MGTQHPIRKVVTPEIPDKLYFRIGDVARLCEVPAYVLRFWETEFPQLKPNKGGTGQRLYRKRDVEMALRIKSLLYDQGYTIPGARGVFKNEVKPRETVTPFESAASAPASAASSLAPEPAEPAPAPTLDRARLESRLRALRHEMQELAALLSAPPGSAPAPKPRTLRPRLVVEPSPLPARADSRLTKAAAPQPSVPKPDPRLPRLVETRQGDLFSAE